MNCCAFELSKSSSFSGFPECEVDLFLSCFWSCYCYFYRCIFIESSNAFPRLYTGWFGGFAAFSVPVKWCTCKALRIISFVLIPRYWFEEASRSWLLFVIPDEGSKESAFDANPPSNCYVLKFSLASLLFENREFLKECIEI